MERKRILIVDDEAGIRFLLSEELRSECSVSCCANGKDALEAFSKNQPDLVITDLKMPKMDGNELTERIKDINPNMPVIMLTATPPAESQADEILKKSSLMKKFHSSVKKFLSIPPLPVST